MPWPAPLPLEGVKSRSREVFGVKKAVITVNGRPCEIAEVTINLRSRILAVGEAGRAVAALLLGQQEPTSGEVSTRHKDLTIAYLTPQKTSETSEDHSAFIADALAKRPHIVVVDEGSTLGGEAWTSAVSQILHDEIPDFQGALVICCSHEGSFAQLHCSTRWMANGTLLQAEDARNVDSVSGSLDFSADDSVQISSGYQKLVADKVVLEDVQICSEDIKPAILPCELLKEEEEDSPLPNNMIPLLLEETMLNDSQQVSYRPQKVSGDDVVVFDDVQVCSEDAKPGTYLGDLLEEVSALSLLAFQEDVLEMIRTKPSENSPPLVLALMVQTSAEKVQNKPDNRLLSFLVYRLWGPPVKTFTIYHLAVSPHLRGLGYGRQMMKWAISQARAMPRSMCGAVTCSSLAEAIPFYQRLGFITDKFAEQVIKDSKVESFTPGQLFMKYKLKYIGPVTKSSKAKKSSKR